MMIFEGNAPLTIDSYDSKQKCLVLKWRGISADEYGIVYLLFHGISFIEYSNDWLAENVRVEVVGTNPDGKIVYQIQSKKLNYEIHAASLTISCARWTNEK